MTDVEGLLVVDKPSGWTSHDVVARVRRLAGMRRVGHAGTLDPMATGVLVIGTGRATRLLGHLSLADKEYDATVRLGVATTTDDAEGEPLATCDASEVTTDSVRRAMATLTGTISQVPAAVSAVKVEGRRAYARVRSGEDVSLPPRTVIVSAFDLLARRDDDLDVHVSCSTGTYVRALARDLGAVLGVGGHLTRLRRTRVGRFDLAQARALDALENGLDVIPLDEAVRRSFPSLEVDAATANRLAHGQRVTGIDVPGPVGVFDPDGRVVALLERRDGTTRSLCVFAAPAD